MRVSHLTGGLTHHSIRQASYLLAIIYGHASEFQVFLPRQARHGYYSYNCQACPDGQNNQGNLTQSPPYCGVFKDYTNY